MLARYSSYLYNILIFSYESLQHAKEIWNPEIFLPHLNVCLDHEVVYICVIRSTIWTAPDVWLRRPANIQTVFSLERLNKWLAVPTAPAVSVRKRKVCRSWKQQSWLFLFWESTDKHNGTLPEKALNHRSVRHQI